MSLETVGAAMQRVGCILTCTLTPLGLIVIWLLTR